MNTLAFLATLVAGLCQTQTQVNLNDGLVAYYPFDGSAQDESGYLRDGTTYGSTSYVVGPWGEQNTSINFNGENTHILLPSNGINLGDNAYSFGFYFSLNNITKTAQTLLNTDPHSGIALGFNRESNRRIYIFIGNCGIDGWVFSFSQYGAKNSFKANEWYHLAFTKKADLYTIYIDGQLDLEISLASPPSLNCQPQFLLGDIHCCNSPEYLNGKMSNVVFYKDRALTPQYIITRLMVKNFFASPTIMPSASPTIVPSMSPTSNVVPIVISPISDKTATVGKPFHYVVPVGEIFIDPYDEILTLSAVEIGKKNLTGWLNFHAENYSFYGTPSEMNIDKYHISLTATDKKGGSVEENFTIIVVNATNMTSRYIEIIIGVGISVCVIIVLSVLCFLMKMKKKIKEKYKEVKITIEEIPNRNSQHLNNQKNDDGKKLIKENGEPDPPNKKEENFIKESSSDSRHV